MMVAARIWEVQPEDVEFQHGVFTCAKNPADRMTFRQLAGRLLRTGGSITCALDEQHWRRVRFGGNIVDVEVDTETGKVDILRYTAFIDAGTAVHPAMWKDRTGGHHPGHWLGAARGILLHHRRPDGQLHLPGLSHAHHAGRR